ncbi:MAG: hypothetical protein M3Q07_01335, partial [Pseudobdellovibrionaceae bacterium]|nr:hypothetical protein [Pseudobdellovibrionaceae bacterium]
MRAFVISTLLMSLAAPQLASAQATESAQSVSKAYAQYERDRDAQRAHQELLNAIDKAKNEITELVLKLEERDIRSCADASLIEFTSFLQGELTTRQILSGKYLTCITEAYRTINEEPLELASRYAPAFHVLNVTTMFM